MHTRGTGQVWWKSRGQELGREKSGREGRRGGRGLDKLSEGEGEYMKRGKGVLLLT